MVLPWGQYWFCVLSLKFCGKSKKICGDISQVSPAFCMYALVSICHLLLSLIFPFFHFHSCSPQILTHLSINLLLSLALGMMGSSILSARVTIRYSHCPVGGYNSHLWQCWSNMVWLLNGQDNGCVGLWIDPPSWWGLIKFFSTSCLKWRLQFKSYV